MSSYYWIKLYHEILNDPKMGRLSNRTWRRAIELFLLAGETANEGILPPASDIAWRLRISEEELIEDLEALAEIGIVMLNGEQWHVVNFIKRQAASVNAERQRQYRDRQRKAKRRRDEDETQEKQKSNEGVTECNADYNTKFAESDTDIESDKETEENETPSAATAPPSASKSKRKPSDEPEATRERKRLERERRKEALVTPLSHPVTPQEEEEEEKKEKEKSTSSFKRKNKEPSQKQQESRAMFSALAKLCQIDLTTLTEEQRGALNQSGLKLREAKATPADMEPFAVWWYANDWRGKKGDAPRPAQVRETWGKFKAWREGGQQYGQRTQSTDPRAPNYRPPLIGLGA